MTEDEKSAAMSDKYSGKKSASLAFAGGTLCIKVQGFGSNDGCGELQIEDDAIEQIPHDERDGSFWLLKLPRSELEAIRVFLNQWLPAAAQPKHDGSELGVEIRQMT